MGPNLAMYFDLDRKILSDPNLNKQIDIQNFNQPLPQHFLLILSHSFHPSLTNLGEDKTIVIY